MNFRSYNDLSTSIRENIHRIPFDIDLVVGVPRSGMLPALQIALARNLPIVELGQFLKGMGSCTEFTQRSVILQSELRKVLVVDDSVGSGTTIRKVKREIQQSFGDHGIQFLFLAPYIAGKSESEVDFYFEKIAFPRIFEWNLFHDKTLEFACLDIDGVICRDPTEIENDDAERYRKFIAEVPVRMLPTATIGWLVTNRLEKYRPETEEWLRKNGFKWGKLIMMNVDSMKTRQRMGNHALMKAEFYRSSPAQIFVESEAIQAQEIARISGKDVICTHDWRVYTPHTFSPIHVRQETIYFANRAKRKMIRSLHAFESWCRSWQKPTPK